LREAVIDRLIASASDKLSDARGVALQVPDELGGVARADIEVALSLTESSLKSDVDELRGNVAAAHAAIRRCRFPLDEHRALFGALAELTYALEDVEQAAAAADYPESETTISLPRQHLVPRGALTSELEALEARLKEFDKKLADIERQQSGAPEFEDQDALIAYAADHAGAQSRAAHELAGQRQVDIRGLFHVIGGLGRIVRSFVSTVAPAVARVTRAVKISAVTLGRSGRDVEAAGGRVMRVALSARPGGFAPGDRFRDFDAAPEMIVVPSGEFLMGSADGEGFDNERPQRKVAINAPFAVGISPVTRGEFAAFIGATNYEIEVGAYVWDSQKWQSDPTRSWRDPGFKQEDDHPVVCVNWHDAKAYVAWLREQSGGKAYRLLSEAEWEYCCRARTTSAYSTGDTITAAQANLSRNLKGTTSISRFPANPWGLRDMHGNVWEWCEDNWHQNYKDNLPTDGSVWPGGDTSFRVLRGGSWVNSPRYLRSAYRNRIQPGDRISDVGFRVARTL
jgi:formylglycine-generating enzyme required for sulfatase activity